MVRMVVVLIVSLVVAEAASLPSGSLEEDSLEEDSLEEGDYDDDDDDYDMEEEEGEEEEQEKDNFSFGDISWGPLTDIVSALSTCPPGSGPDKQQMTGPTTVLVTGGENSAMQPAYSFIFPDSPGCHPPPLPDSSFKLPIVHRTFSTPSGRLATCGGGGNTCVVLEGGKWQADPQQPEAWSLTWSMTRVWAWARCQELVPHLPRSVEHASVVSLPEGVLLLGGWSPYFTSSLLLRPGGTSWEEGPQLPGSGAVDSCSVVWRGNVLLVGGEGASPGGGYNQVRELNTATWQWEDESKWPQLPGRGRGRHACAIVNSKLIVSGGNGRADRTLDWDGLTYIGNRTPTLILDLSAGAEAVWVEGGKLNIARFGHSMVAAGAAGREKLYALGGKDDARRLLDAVEVWQEDSSTWLLEEERMEENRVSFGAVAVDMASVCPE